MICKNCNAQLEDGAAFCHMCGAKCVDETAQEQAYAMAAANEQPAESAQVFEEAVSSKANNAQDYQQYSEPAEGTSYEAYAPAVDPAPKKKGRGKIVLIAVIAVVLLIAAAGVIFGKTLFFAIAPETYVASIASNTIEKLAEEVDSIEKNVFGFDISADKDFTLRADVVYNDGDEEYKVNGAFANLPGKEKMLFEGSYEDDYGKGDMNGFWDNENIGVMTVGTDDEYLSVPAKDFGEEFENSGGYVSEYIYENSEELYDILTTLDLSYKTLYDNSTGKSNMAKRTSKHYSKNLIELLKKGSVGGRNTVKYEFDDGKVKAKKITLSLSTKNLYDFLINSLEDIKNDGKLEEDINKDAFKKYIKQLKDAKKEIDNVDYEIEIIEYKGKIVSMAYTTEADEIDYWDNYYRKTTITYGVKDRDHFLNGIEVAETSDYDYSDDDSSYGSKGVSDNKFGITSNWVTEDKEINITLYDSYSDSHKSDGSKYEYENEDEVELYIDYGKGKWNVKVKDSYSNSDGDKDTNITKYKGTCSKKGGFSFKIDEEWEEEVYTNNMSYDEWIEDGYDDWLEEVYEENREDYLDYVYEEEERFYYDYDTFDDWFKVYGAIWDTPDSDFEEWLFEYENLYDSDDIYEEATREIEKRDAYLKVDLSLKPKAELKFKKADTENILEWERDDFRDFTKDAQKEFEKKTKKKK